MLRSSKIILFSIFIIGIEMRSDVDDKISCPNFESYYTKDLRNNCYHNPDVLSDIMSIIRRHNYIAETFITITRDGYILTVFKVHPKAGSDSKGKAPVFIQHGMATNSIPWVNSGNLSLAFHLCDLGYEVFLGNLRGSTYSRHHIYYNDSTPQFWNFNLDDVAENDIPAQLELVARLTRKAGYIIYLGHSMGTTLYFMFSSEFPEQSRHLVQGAIALAPVVYFPEKWYVRVIANIIEKSLENTKIVNIFNEEDAFHKILVFGCLHFPQICGFIHNLLLKISPNFPAEYFFLLFSTWPGAIAVKQVLHFVQIALSGDFKKYDYGEFINTKLYGSPSPPLYDLTKITLPTYLLYGGNDFLYDENTVWKLFDQLGSEKKGIAAVPEIETDFGFTHLDFLYGSYTEKYLHSEIFSLLERFKKVPT